MGGMKSFTLSRGGGAQKVSILCRNKGGGGGGTKRVLCVRGEHEQFPIHGFPILYTPPPPNPIINDQPPKYYSQRPRINVLFSVKCHPLLSDLYRYIRPSLLNRLLSLSREGSRISLNSNSHKENYTSSCLFWVKVQLFVALT